MVVCPQLFEALSSLPHSRDGRTIKGIRLELTGDKSSLAPFIPAFYFFRGTRTLFSSPTSAPAAAARSRR